MLPLTGYLHTQGRSVRGRASPTRRVARLRGHDASDPHRDPGGLPHMSGHTSGFKRLPLLVLSLALATTPVRAQVAGHVWEGSGGLGFVQYDSRDHLRASGMLTASLGYRWSPALTFEGAWLGALTKR